jgi:formate--tetrahydrofolate ligase
MLSDIEVARAARLSPIADIAAKLDIPADALVPYGRYKAKIDRDFLASLRDHAEGRLILVTAMSPTPAGEGKTTTTIGLGDAMNRIGLRTAICLREPSLGPCFGQKGGATGGGQAQVAPMDEINLHFTGDFHAITTAHNLLAALVDNHVYWGNPLGLDPRRIVWRRVMDMNDRALRRIVSSLGGNGAPAETGFDITVASEVMAILCLATDLADLQARLGRIIVGYAKGGAPVTCADLKADGAMTALLKDAVLPNLVQTLEGNPALIHGGPFANIAHGCNSVIATQAALRMADYVVTEAGFGADLGAEKFFDIKCRQAGLKPAAVVVVATIRSLKMNGGVAKSQLGAEDIGALRRGCENLGRHVENLRQFGVPPRSRRCAPSPKLWGWRSPFAGTGRKGGPARRSWRARSRLSSIPAPAGSRRSMPTTCRCGARLRRSPGRFTEPNGSPPTRPSTSNCPDGARLASATCRCAWPRPSTAFRPTLNGSGPRWVTRCMSGKSD